MRVVVQTVVSERDFGTIVSARVEELGHPRAGEIIRVKALNPRIVGRPLPGEVWQVEGEVKESQWGPQIEAIRAFRTLPTGKLVRDFVASHVPGVGPERAEALWKRFGLALPDVLADKEKLALIAEVIAPDRPNFGPQLAAACVRAYQDAAVEARTVMWLAQKGVDDVMIARRVALVLGTEAVERLQENPYLLVPLLPWAKVDKLGLHLLAEAGCCAPRHDGRRLVGAVDAVVKRAISEGHTAVPNQSLRLILAKSLGVSERSPLIDVAVAIGERNGAVIRSDAVWRAPGCAAMEDAVVSRLWRMLTPDYPNCVPIPIRQTVDRFLNRFDVGGYPLHDEQRAAVLKVLQSPLACLQGGAGVGKTSTIKAICDIWENEGGHLLLCTIAGKAALKLSRSTGRLAMTIARLLAQLRERARLMEQLADPDLDNKRREKFTERLVGLADLTQVTLVVADEASMIDLGSIHALLRYMPSGSRLLLVGDEAQLPPVNFGLLYHRLVEEETITARLTVVHRQTESSGIPPVAAAIRGGRMPTLAPYAGLGKGVSMLRTAPDDLARTVERVWEELGGQEAKALIVTATNNGVAGIRGLNKRLHGRHVDQFGLAELKGYLGEWFSVGDPVVFLRNDYAKGLFNGLLGRVISIDCEARSCVVQFDGYDEPHEIGPNNLIDLALAYAITCHRGQGSEAPAVVVPLYRCRVLDRSWLYTAVTRAEHQVVLVGSEAVLREAIARPLAVERRVVGLQWKAGRRVEPMIQITSVPMR